MELYSRKEKISEAVLELPETKKGGIIPALPVPLGLSGLCR